MLSSCIIHILHIHLYVLILSYILCFRILSVLFLYWFKANTFISHLYFSYYVNFYLIFPISRRSIRLILLLSYHILSYVFIYVFMYFHILYFSYTFLFSLLSTLYLFISFSCTTLCNFYILYLCTVHVLFLSSYIHVLFISYTVFLLYFSYDSHILYFSSYTVILYFPIFSSCTSHTLYFPMIFIYCTFIYCTFIYCIFIYCTFIYGIFTYFSYTLSIIYTSYH